MWSVIIIVLKKGQGLNNDNKKLAGANVVEPARLWELIGDFNSLLPLTTNSTDDRFREIKR